MGVIADILPLVAFFVGYKLGDIFIATAAIMAAMPIQFLLLKLSGRSFEGVHKATFVLVLVFGALTLTFREGAFIQWKSTAVNFGFAAVLLFSHKVMGRNLVRMMLSKMVEMEERDWGLVSHLLAGFFLFMATLNTALIYSVSEETWVNIKTFGYPVLSVLATGLVIAVASRRARLIEKDDPSTPEPEGSASVSPPKQAQ